MIQIFKIVCNNYENCNDEEKWFLSIEHIANDEYDLKIICEIFSLYLNDNYCIGIHLDSEDIKLNYEYNKKQKIFFDYKKSIIGMSECEYKFNKN